MLRCSEKFRKGTAKKMNLGLKMQMAALAPVVMSMFASGALLTIQRPIWADVFAIGAIVFTWYEFCAGLPTMNDW